MRTARTSLGAALLPFEFDGQERVRDSTIPSCACHALRLTSVLMVRHLPLDRAVRGNIGGAWNTVVRNCFPVRSSAFRECRDCNQRMTGFLQLSTLAQEANVLPTTCVWMLCRRCVRPAAAPIMPTRKEICSAANCGVRYLPTRSGCGGRQKIVQSYMDHARALLKPEAAVGDWICTIHRNKLRQCVEDDTAPQAMVSCDRSPLSLSRARCSTHERLRGPTIEDKC
jgi:hypothetical protein